MPSPSVTPRNSGLQRVLLAGDCPVDVAAGIGVWSDAAGLDLQLVQFPLERRALRHALPMLVLLAVDGHEAASRTTLQSLKSDGRLQSVPIVILLGDADAAPWLDSGADEVVRASLPDGERDARLSAAVRRTRRDIQVNPSTRLAGSDALSSAMVARIERGELFGACYADLDHFKEFNDRYGYAHGDNVIRGVAELIVEVVEAAAGDHGFVGHIGGDDFLFLVPLDCVSATCDLLVQRADEILPARYSALDRQAGYFFGKDRRGRLDRVALMTLSIGVVTNARRRFLSPAQVSELATEMKTYAKTLPGSVWAMDRRSDGESIILPEEKCQ